MPAWPSSILSFGVNLLTARTAMQLRRARANPRAQRAAYRRLISRLAQTSYWRESGIVAGMDYGEFRARVAPRNYEAVQSAVARMVRGEADVLWPGSCSFFSTSSGTTCGQGKLLPATVDMLRHLRAACRDALLYYTARVGHAGVFHGKHLFLTGSTALKPIGEPERHRAFAGQWPAIAALGMPPWLEARIYEPGAAIGHIDDWQAKLEAVAARTFKADISLIAGIPPWVLSFVDFLREKHGYPASHALKELWPNLECYVHGGVPPGPYLPELRSALGSKVTFHEIYAAAEGFFAAQDSDASGQLRVMDNVGLFYEFLPLADFDEARLSSLGEKAVPLADVKTGVDYVVLLTSPAGLARYLVGDIVRFTSTVPPRLTYVGRTSLQLSAFEERVLERDVTEALVAVCQRHRWSIVNFHVAPLFGANLTGQTRGRHEWWVELKPGTKETPTGPQMATELDAELQRLNREYGSRRASGRIDAPTVRLVMPGVFRHWLKFHGRWGGQNKLARCRSDRLVADELAQITRFARD